MNIESQAQNQYLLKITDLVIEGFQENHWQNIVHGVSLHLNRGEVLGLIGESGAGKSTIGIASMFYTRPGCRITSGKVVFDGIDLTTAGETELRKLRGVRISYVAQSAAASFNPAHRLIQQYAEAPVQHQVMSLNRATTEAKKLYARLHLPEANRIGNRYPHQVSGGQLQRAMVAMAMACKPDLIVFDEPTTALDVTTQIEVLAAIKEAIKELNTAAIYITHDLAVVAQIADRIMVLRHGYMVEEGSVHSVLESPQQQYTQELLSVRRHRGTNVEHSRTDSPVLKVDQVTAGYVEGVDILKNVSLELHRGETVAVVGESGSGKSTLARVVTGLLIPRSGSVAFHGETLLPSFQQRDRNMLRKMQMIYQMPDVALNPRQKVKDILKRPLEFYMGISGEPQRRRVSELLTMIELDDSYADRYPSELSGGEKQRVCIARALAAEPELLLCDEVTSALDQLVAEEILKLLQRLQNKFAISYLFITHDLATVKVISDEIVVMLQGGIVEQGPRDQILTPPHHEYTELLLASVPEMKPDWLDTLLETRAGEKLRDGSISTQV